MPHKSQTIQILPPELTALIAAGEVVERPASIVKELLENALDAGAKAINVEVREGGLRLIRVSDAGSGMSRADAPLAVKAFATSKISAPAHLQTIRTFGFRGEALSSIAAVADLSILTRTAHEVEGTRITLQSGETNVGPAASPVGTSVSANYLFSKTPARRKFLKSPIRELTLVQQVITKYALAHPQVAFRLAADGQARLALPPGSTLERIGSLLGRDIAGEMIAIQWEALDLRVNGFISSPVLARSRRDRQYFFVKRRPIRSGLLAVMLERPFTGLLPPGRYPLAVINIEIDPAFVDVNVHPQKTEVRFSRERSVYAAVSQAVSNALQDFPRQAIEGENALLWPFTGIDGVYSLHEEQASYQVRKLRPLAQIHHTYILAQSADDILIIDQHAAHEQILYESLTAGASNSVEIKALQIELTSSEADLLNANISLFASLGFELEPYGKHTFLIRSLPAAIQAHLPNQVAHSTQALENILLTTLLQELQAHKTLVPETQRDKLAQKAACVCALKSGDTLSTELMQILLDELVETWSPAACPHGRPVFVSLTLKELERRFGRR